MIKIIIKKLPVTDTVINHVLSLAHKPIRVIVLYINFPVSELSDFYKISLTKACPRPAYVIKNSLNFKEKIKHIPIPHHCFFGCNFLVSQNPF